MLKLTDLLQSVNDMIIMSVTIMPTQHSLPRTYRQIERSEKGGRGLLESSEANLHKSTWGDFINVMRKTAFGFCNLFSRGLSIGAP